LAQEFLRKNGKMHKKAATQDDSVLACADPLSGKEPLPFSLNKCTINIVNNVSTYPDLRISNASDSDRIRFSFWTNLAGL
jgi:hypothetical protein